MLFVHWLVKDNSRRQEGKLTVGVLAPKSVSLSWNNGTFPQRSLLIFHHLLSVSFPLAPRPYWCSPPPPTKSCSWFNAVWCDWFWDGLLHTLVVCWWICLRLARFRAPIGGSGKHPAKRVIYQRSICNPWRKTHTVEEKTWVIGSEDKTTRMKTLFQSTSSVHK